MALQIYGLTCEYMQNPIGIDEKNPRLSYKLRSDEPGCIQTSRRLEVSLYEDFASLCADSGFVEDDDTLFIETGLKLSACTRYHYRFTVRDNLGREVTSAPAFFETGLLGTAWRAKWITRPDENAGDDVVPRYMRDFRLAEAPVKARLYITACGVYRAQINGEFVSPDLLAPGYTSYNKHQQYQTYDVTELLSAGKNEFSAIVGPGWFTGNLIGKNRWNIYGDRTALLCRLDMTFADGRTRRIVSDEKFTWAESEILYSQIYHGEDIDARRVDLPRNSVAILDRGYNMLIGQQMQSVRPIEEIEPIELITTPKGERVLDFGQNMVGFVRVRIKAQAGREIRLRHFEVLDKDGNAYFENYRTARAVASYVTSGGDDIFEAMLTFYGFRYVCIDAFPGEPALENFTGVVIHTELEPTNEFSCSHPLLNQLQHNIIWGQKGNFVDLPTDCPQRDERLGWTGDAQVFSSTALQNMQSGAFFTKWFWDLRADQTEAGAVPIIVPNSMIKQNASNAWSDCVTVIPMDMWQAYGDKRILQDNYAAMKKWIGYMKAWGDDPYTFNGHFQFGDWLGLDGDSSTCNGGTSNELIANAFYAYSTRLTAETAEILGYTGEAKKYRNLYAKVRSAFNRDFVTPGGRLAAGPRNQTAFILAIWFDLVDGKALEHCKKELIASLRLSGNHLTTGFVGTPYLCHTFSQIGEEDRAFGLLLQETFPSWLFSVRMGATTMWEHWDGIRPDGTFWSPTMNSYNHYAYGSIGNWMYRHIGGIGLRKDAPAYKVFDIAPSVGGGGLTESSIRFESIRGTITCAWTLAENTAKLRVTVPANTEADFTPYRCADISAVKILQNGKAFAATGERTRLPSGEYEITYPVLPVEAVTKK